MDAIMDLTTRAVSFITAIQTTLLRGAIAMGEENSKISILTITQADFQTVLERYIEEEDALNKNGLSKLVDDSFSVKAIELFWVSKKRVSDEEISKICLAYAVVLSVNLFNWIQDNRKHGIEEFYESKVFYPTPFAWRQTISAILYRHPEQRVALATALQYLPIQIVLALGGGSFSAYRQRISQIWKIRENQLADLLNAKEIGWLMTFPADDHKKEHAEMLLRNDQGLLEKLKEKKVPLSFEQIFTAELNEININRVRRVSEEQVALQGVHSASAGADSSKLNDPFEKAQKMNGLTALAFSGGGIRSATFNLGILQGLAKKSLIGKFDYLSTVSGGGYIGSWLAAWIKRDGSVVKVTNRLCADKSPDPAGEELRPIKWLRMFSNYFSPNASIMSADAWTVGVTWLRNTLLNQTIIFFSLIAVLFAGNLLFIGWQNIMNRPIYYTGRAISIYSIVALLPVSLLAGFGMHAYHSQGIRWLRIRKEDTNRISATILFIAFAGAYFISAWLCSNWYYNGSQSLSFSSKISALWPATVVNFVSLMIVALLGKYYQCIRDLLSTGSNWKREIETWVLLVGTALGTAFLSSVSMAGAWALLQKIDIQSGDFKGYNNQLKFVLGFPLVLEVFSVTLVIRMALLGRYFPDERREWWGRMGAYIHRTSFLWILVASAALLGKDFIFHLFVSNPKASTAVTGGWLAMIVSAVKAAFSSKVSGDKKSTSTFSLVTNILALLGPYLFALGLLIFLPGLIKPIYEFVHVKIFHDPHLVTNQQWDLILLIIAVCFLTALLLSMQVGVNEFSMHHFYRNRLVRAYLGATRRFTDRQKSSNPFTGFDMRDDEKLSKMTNKHGYYGPYPILNVALNASEVTDLARQDRKAESFIFSPFYCGFDFSMMKASADSKIKSYDYAYRETKYYAFKDDGPGIGTAMAISGAAVNPNQGFHSSAATAFLLTVFNVQMGWWMGNPRKSTFNRSEPRFGLGYIFNNLVGKTNTRSDYVALSDGGHFDNMGLYELIRRRCSSIILCDAEQDDEFTCEGFANAIRRCRIDFGADIIIDISKITDRTEDRFSASHFALGEIFYPGNPTPGKLLYIKSSIIKQCQPVDVFEYAKKHSTFPHQTTADQFFDEEQFESYRKLGLWIATQTFSDDMLKELGLV